MPRCTKSGTLFYDYVTSNLYAVVYTALPILLYGTYDRDISADTCLRYACVLQDDTILQCPSLSGWRVFDAADALVTARGRDMLMSSPRE